jgi:WD40 repeat protein
MSEQSAGNAPRFAVIAVDAHAIAVAEVEVWLWTRQGHEIGKGHRVLTGSEHSVNALRLTPDGKQLIALDIDGTITVWATATGKQLAHWKAHGESAAALAVHPRLPLVASGGDDGALKIWSLDGTGPVTALEKQGGAVQDLAFSPAGDHLLAAIDNRPVLFDVSVAP